MLSDLKAFLTRIVRVYCVIRCGLQCECKLHKAIPPKYILLHPSPPKSS